MQGQFLKWTTTALTVATVILAVRLGFIYWERSRPEPAPKKEAKVSGIPPELDTLELKILNFYTADQPVRGEPFVLCYGVLNATDVKMEPPLAEVRPSVNRCVNVTLKEETELTLRAYGKEGEETAATFRIGVKEPRPEFLFVSISAREIKRGERFTICYGVKKATKVWLEPGPRMLGASEKTCAMLFPTEAPKKIVAESAGGREEVVLPVKMKR